ncbi:MAG: hypothetical protein HKM95_06060, partial [Inquilinus sp.]|nr:hypothetical protein [Inquilinus sp.]
MHVNRFQTLLDAHGPDIARWPPEMRAEAEALLAVSEQARRALAEARLLDRALSGLPSESAGPLLRSAVLDIPEIHDQSPALSAGHHAVGGWSARRRAFAAGWPAIA